MYLSQPTCSRSINSLTTWSQYSLDEYIYYFSYVFTIPHIVFMKSLFNHVTVTVFIIIPHMFSSYLPRSFHSCFHAKITNHPKIPQDTSWWPFPLAPSWAHWPSSSPPAVAPLARPPWSARPRRRRPRSRMRWIQWRRRMSASSWVPWATTKVRWFCLVGIYEYIAFMDLWMYMIVYVSS